jgi:hypothetical protein
MVVAIILASPALIPAPYSQAAGDVKFTPDAPCPGHTTIQVLISISSHDQDRALRDFSF